MDRQRNSALDALRGLALLGVILVNLLTEFRVSFFDYLVHFHTEPGRLNHGVDWVVGVLVERKAFAVLSLLFGWSTAAIASHAPVGISGTLLRRFVFLLAL